MNTRACMDLLYYKPSHCRYNWIAILLLVFCYTISAFAAAVGSPTKAYGFMAIWNCLLLIGYSVGGTLILRNVRVLSLTRDLCRACVPVCALRTYHPLVIVCSPRRLPIARPWQWAS